MEIVSMPSNFIWAGVSVAPEVLIPPFGCAKLFYFETVDKAGYKIFI